MFNPLNSVGWIIKNGIKVLILIVIIGSILFLLYSPDKNKYLGFLPNFLNNDNGENADIVSFEPEKVKEFYDAVLTEDTLDNLKGNIPKVKNISCNNDECNITTEYKTENGTMTENITMINGNILNPSSEYIIPDPEHIIYTGNGDISETDEYSNPSIEKNTLNISVEGDINCGINVSEVIYSLYPNGNVYIVISGTSKQPEDCITHKIYSVSVPLPKDYKVRKTYVTFPYGKKV